VQSPTDTAIKALNKAENLQGSHFRFLTPRASGYDCLSVPKHMTSFEN